MPRTRKTPPAEPAPSESGVGRRLLALVTLALFAAAGFGAYRLWQAAQPALQAEPAYQLAFDAITVEPLPPDWAGETFLAEVRRRSDLPETLSLLESDLAARLAEAFRRHPWVAEVRAVRVVWPSRVEVQLSYRRPAAMVEVPGGLYPVDAHGTLLSTERFTADEARRFPIIRAAPSSPSGPAGSRWGDPLVHEAAALAAVLADVWQELNLAAIEGTLWNAGGESEAFFYLISAGGTRVVWGRSPNTDHPGEIAAEEKIERLLDYVQREGSLEAPAGPYELDIRHWGELSRRPLQAG